MIAGNEPSPRAAPSLALRLTTLFALSALVIVIAVGLVVYLLLANSLRHEEDQFLNNKVRILIHEFREQPPDLPELKEEVEEDFAPHQYVQVFARVIDANHHVVVESPNMSQLLPVEAFPPPRKLSNDVMPGTLLRSPDGAEFRALSTAATAPDDGIAGEMQVALDQATGHRLLRRYARGLAVTVVLALLVAAALDYLVVRRALRPLREISDMAQRIQPNRLDGRIEPQKLPKELALVASRLNRMLDRLEESFARLSGFSIELAHELRTPLNNLASQIDVALGRDRSAADYKDVLSSCSEECGRLARIINGLLFIARCDDPRTQIQIERINVRQMLNPLAEMYLVLMNEQGLTLTIDCPSGLVLDADKTLLQRAIDNLIANAVAHTPSGGRISVHAAQGDDCIDIEVSDTGSGIPEQELQKVFERFYPNPGRKDAHQALRLGLGLSIVRGIMSLHGGFVTLKSKVGEGTRVSLRFPTFRQSSQTTPFVMKT